MIFLRHRHSRLHSDYQPGQCRYPQGGALYQCRPRIQRGQGAEHPALRRYREDCLCLPEQAVPPLKPRKPLGEISSAVVQYFTNAITTPPLRGTPPEEGNQEDELREQIPLPRRGGGRSLTGWSRQQSSPKRH